MDNHFNQTVKMVEIGSNTVRRINDYKLNRYACYLIAQNGDPKKSEIALAQTYFAIQTRRQEIFEQLSIKEKKKGIKKGELLDRAGSTELAANLFRITQTDEKINKANVSGEKQATHTHFMVGGKVRQTIKDIGGVLPEHLPTEKHIKEVKKEVKKLVKNDKNTFI